MTLETTLGYVSTLCGLLYIVLLIKEKTLAWIFGFFSTAILVYIFAMQKIYMHTLLNFYYSVIAIYAYITWQKKSSNNTPVVKITEWPVRIHIFIIALIGIVTILFYKTLIVLNSNYPFIDSLVFCGSIVATFMQAKKVLSNWLYWIVLNSLTIIMLLLAHVYSIVALMLIYLICAIIGYFNWKKTLSKAKKS